MTDSKPSFKSASHSRLDSSAQLLVFEPGLYSIGLNPVASTIGDNGLRLPCVRIDALPPGPASPGQAQVAIMTEGGWLSLPEQRGFVRVEGGRASLVVTTYLISGSLIAPEIHVSLVERRTAAAAVMSTENRAPALSEEAVVAEAEAGFKGPRFKLHVHASVLGDIAGSAGEWVGRAGHPLEAFSLRDIEGLSAADVEYQAILGRNWNTPWIPGNTFCGSRGIAMPILGLRIRLLAAAAALYDVVYAARFEGGTEVGPVSNGEACVEGRLVLEALQVSILDRARNRSESPAQQKRAKRNKA